MDQRGRVAGLRVCVPACVCVCVHVSKKKKNREVVQGVKVWLTFWACVGNSSQSALTHPANGHNDGFQDRILLSLKEE